MSSPSWLLRALDPSTPTTEDNESVRTASAGYKGKEILFPTIRLENGKLVNYGTDEKGIKRAKQIALIKGDYLTFGTPDEATAYSKQLSDQISKNRSMSKPGRQKNNRFTSENYVAYPYRGPKPPSLLDEIIEWWDGQSKKSTVGPSSDTSTRTDYKNIPDLEPAVSPLLSSDDAASATYQAASFLPLTGDAIAFQEGFDKLTGAPGVMGQGGANVQQGFLNMAEGAGLMGLSVLGLGGVGKAAQKGAGAIVKKIGPPVSANPTTQKRLDKAYEKHGDAIYMDEAGTITGSMQLQDDIPLTFNGKEPKDWSVDETNQVGKIFNVNLAPTSQELKENMLEVDVDNYIPGPWGANRQAPLRVPGGYEGKFTPYEQHMLHSQGVDPNQLPPDDYWKLHDKMIRSVDPEGNLTDTHMYNQLMFGITSPNNPLTPNQLAVGRLRANSIDDIQRMASMVPWNYRNADEKIKEIGDTYTVEKRSYPVGKKDQRKYVHMLNDERKKAGLPKIPLRKGQKTVKLDTFIHPDGTALLNSAGMPVKSRTGAVRNWYSKRIADIYGVGAGSRGGIGASGSADYSKIAEMAQMFKDNPKFFRKSDQEDWPQYAERVSNQIRGLDYKTGYMGTVWQDPLNAMNAPVDRHIGFAWMKDPGSTELRDNAVKEWNRLTKQKSARNEVYGKPQVSSFEELENTPGGHGWAVNYAMSQAYMPNKASLMRSKGGDFNPNLPERAKGIDWIYEPEKFDEVPENYGKALEASFTGQGGDRKVFNQQWGEWDLIRKRISPHETINPALEGMPRMSIDQIKDVDQNYKKFRYKSPKIKGETVPTIPARGKNPMDFFYSGILGPEEEDMRGFLA